MKHGSVLATFFGGLSGGQLGRGAFFWRLCLIVAVFLAISVGLGMTGGIAGWAAFYIPVSALLCFAALNILAKRFRDIGLSGWIGVGVVLGIGVLLALVVPGPVEIFYGLAAILGLSVFPGRYVTRSSE
ncbi:MAG: DUF805 domain-containing protein [Pseudomonadota bacterium]